LAIGTTSNNQESRISAEVAGTVVVTGSVEEIGLRFIKPINFYNQKVFIPNRTIANVSRFPHGGIHAYADVLIPPGGATGKAAKSSRTSPKECGCNSPQSF